VLVLSGIVPTDQAGRSEIVRGIFLKGTGVPALRPQMATLLVHGMAVMGLSASSFRKKLD
jgi:hypothetical protein